MGVGGDVSRGMSRASNRSKHFSRKTGGKQKARTPTREASEARRGKAEGTSRALELKIDRVSGSIA